MGDIFISSLGIITAPAHLPVGQQDRDSSWEVMVSPHHPCNSAQWILFNTKKALQLFTLGFGSHWLILSAFSELFPKMLHACSTGFLHSARRVRNLFRAFPFGHSVDLLQEIFFLLMAFCTLLFSSSCPGKPLYSLFESVLCICILSSLPPRLQTFHPCVQLLNSEELPHFFVISLFSIKHCISSFLFFPLQILCTNWTSSAKSVLLVNLGQAGV